MPDPKVVLTPTQQAIAENDAQEGSKTPFDPKVHGVGTVAKMAPGSVSELFKMHQELAAKFDGLEGDAATYISGRFNSFESRLRQLELSMQAIMNSGSPQSNEAQQKESETAPPAQPEPTKPASAFSKKKDSVQ